MDSASSLMLRCSPGLDPGEPRSICVRVHQPFEAKLRLAPQGEGSSNSHHRHAAVYVQGLAGHIGGFFRSKVKRGGGDVIGGA